MSEPSSWPLSQSALRVSVANHILIYCADGKGLLRLGNEKKAVKAGELFILPPNTIHAYQADEEQPWTVYWCHFQGEQAKDFFDYIYQNQSSEIIRNMTDIDFIQAFRELIETVRDSTQLSDFIHASNLFRHILTKIERQMKRRDRYENGLSIPKIQQFMRVNINKHLSLLEQTSLSMSEIASQLGYDDALYFSRVFRKILGLAPSVYRKSLLHLAP